MTHAMETWFDAAPDGVTDGVKAVATERRRQIDEEGFTASHDAEHDRGELARAASGYAWYAVRQVLAQMRGVDAPSDLLPPDWPWDHDAFNPSDDPLANLAKSGALAAAEIDRIRRAQEADGG